MPLVAQILSILGVASMFLSMGAAYLAGPKLKAYLKRQTPSVDVPPFDLGDRRGTDRLVSLLWRVKVPTDRPRLRRLVIAHRAFLVAAPLLLLASLTAAMLLTNADGQVESVRRGAPPPISLTIQGASGRADSALRGG